MNILRFGDARLDVGDHRLLDFTPQYHAESPFFAVVRAFIRDTYERCSFHRRRMQKAGIDEVTSFDDLRRIPLLWSEEVGAISEFALLPDEYRSHIAGSGIPHAQRIAKKFTTSGSTGRPKVTYYTMEDWEAHIWGARRNISHVPIEHTTRCLNLFNPGHIAGKFFEDAWNRRGLVVETRHFSVSTPDDAVRQMYAGFADVGGFNFLCLPPAGPVGTTVQKGIHLSDLLDADVENHIGRSVRAIMTGGTARDVRINERVWEANELAGAPRTVLVDLYGCAEISLIASECEENDGVHLRPGTGVVEVIDRETGAHVESGGRGLVVVTGLMHGSRYLRYVLGDEATFLTDPCACGRATPRLMGIQRVLDKERIRQGCAGA